MNNVQFLPVPCIISSEIVLLFLLHTLMHGKLNIFFEKKINNSKTNQEPSIKLTKLFNNLLDGRGTRVGKSNPSGKTASALK